MNGPVPTFAGWYPDIQTGGTRYWSGSHWTGDVRPPRLPFAASSGDRGAAVAFLGFGGFFMFMSIFAKGINDGSVSTVGLFFTLFLVGCGVSTLGVYMFRGQGPSTQSIETRLATQRKEAKAKRRSANLWGIAANLTGSGRSRSAGMTNSDSASVAQINAISNPQTAKSLQNLQTLLYTRTITDAEYQGAKDKLLGTPVRDDSFAQIAKLADLHEAGILGDVEFSAAKAKALGL